MMRGILAALSAAILAACSEPVIDSYVPERFLSDSHLPDSIAGLPVAIPTYEFYSCDKLLAERAVILREIRVAETTVAFDLPGTTAGVVVLGQPLDAVPERLHDWLIGVAKMRVEAINGIALKRGCRADGPVTATVAVPVQPLPPAGRPLPGTTDPVVVGPYGHIK